MKITAVAPCKIIITGEHGVVHGSPALAMAIEPFNEVTLENKPGKPNISIKLKENKVELNEKGEVISGNIDWQVFLELTKRLIENGIKIKDAVSIEIKSNVPKGVGASSSVAAALCIALYKYAGVSFTKESLFEDVQWSDEIAHGGRAGGIDAMTVIAGSTKVQKTVADGKLKWNFEHVDVSLPLGSELIVIDTSSNGKRSSTAETVRKVSNALGFVKPDGSIKQITEFSETDKKKVEPFKKIFEKIVKQLNLNGDPITLGKAMDENHNLLASFGITSDAIELARRTSMKNGAYGSKISGGGGEGGAVICLVKKADAENIIAKLKEKNFNAFKAKPTKGAVEWN